MKLLILLFFTYTQASLAKSRVGECAVCDFVETTPAESHKSTLTRENIKVRAGDFSACKVKGENISRRYELIKFS